MGDDRSSTVQFRDGSQIDGERQHHLLTFAQAQVGGFDKYARSTQIDRLAQLSAAARDSDIDNCSCTVPRVQAAFHLNEPRVFLVVVRRDRQPLCRCPALHHAPLQLNRPVILGRRGAVGKGVLRRCEDLRRCAPGVCP